MATQSGLKKMFDQSRVRSFSESIKKSLVRRIEKNELSVGEASKEYEVSRASIYNWVYKYSSLYKKGHKQVIEHMSSSKKIKTLQERIKALERIVGQKQIMVDFYEKMIELTEKELGIDIKKKGGSTPSYGSGPTKKK
jgi:transposase